MAHAAPSRATYADYLEVERNTGKKHEFCDGAILAMAGGTPAHADLGMNIGVLLHAALAGKPCRPSNSDQKIRVLATGLTTYPDLSVFCGARIAHPEDPNAFVNPTVIVEVLSEGTEAYDRGEKFDHYAQIPSLRAYVMVSTRRRRVEVMECGPDGSWTVRRYGPGERAVIKAIGVELPVERAYEGVDIP